MVKKLDDAAIANKDVKMGSFVVMLDDDSDKMEKTLKTLAEKEKLTKLVLAVDSAAGPDDYDISKDADVTVVLYAKKKVVKNMVFAKGKFDSKAVDAVISELKSIVPEAKK